MDGWMDKWMEGKKEGRTGGWIDGMDGMWVSAPVTPQLLNNPSNHMTD
jgi:hypothetical protein